MLLPLPDLLNTNELSQAHLLLETAHWSDGRASAGVQAMLVKNNQQLPHDSEAAHTVRQLVLNALDRHPQFFSAVLPKRVYTPTINRYTGGSNHYGQHVDNAIRFAPDSGQRVRTDISCTVFLSNPSTYEGGELVIHEAHGNQLVKLPAGHAVIYPGTHVHQVLPVTSGERLACFFWIESMVRSPEQRRLLYDMDLALTQLRQTHGDDPTTVALTGTYHNLLRMWADA